MKGGKRKNERASKGREGEERGREGRERMR